jgi:hypothetical protein
VLHQTQTQLDTIIKYIDHLQPREATTLAFGCDTSVRPTSAGAAASASPIVETPVARMPLPDRLLNLGDGEVLRITSDSIPDPPAISFANDIPLLNSMWDFRSAEWSGTFPLVVDGHPIPVSHWPELYKYGKKDQWKGMKARWFEWKV